MKAFSKKMTGLLLLLVSILSPTPALAQIKTWNLGGTTVERRPELAGTVVEDTIRTWSWYEPRERITVNGTLQDRVVRRQKSGTLDFYSRIMLEPQSAKTIWLLRREGFRSPLAKQDVDYRIDGLGDTSPISVARDETAGVYEFSWAGRNIVGGKSSNFVFIGTTATIYDRTGTTNLFAFSGSPIPIPNTYRPVS